MKKGIIAAGILIIIVSGIIALMVFGGVRLYVATGSKKYIAYHEICGHDVVDRFISVKNVLSNDEENSEQIKDKLAELSRIAEDVKSLPDHHLDATCNYIVLDEAIESGKIDIAKEYHDKFKNTISGPLYITTRFEAFDNIRMIDARIKSMGVVRDETRGD